MADPELTRQNRNASALAGAVMAKGDLPPDSISPQAAADARADALALLGNTVLNPPAPLDEATTLPDLPTMADQARLLTGLAPACLGQLGSGFIWAAKLPGQIPIYPRGHVTEAAGVDQPVCQLRAVQFNSAAAPADVIAFYYTLAHKAGMRIDYRQMGKAAVLRGGAGNKNFMLIVQDGPAGSSSMRLTTSGFTA